MEQKLTFTAFLQDQYSKKFEKLAESTDEGVKEIIKDLDKLGRTGKTVTRSIEALDRKIQSLTKAKKLSLNTDTIRAANAEIRALQREKAKLEGNVNGGSGNGWLGGMGRGFAIAGGIYAGGRMLKQGFTSSLQAAMEREQQRITLGVLTGSQANGDSLLQQMVGMAAKTPFGTNDLIKSSQTMLGFGVKQGDIMQRMRELGDISAGNADRFQNLSLAFGQVTAAGRLMGQEVLQMINNGFNPLQAISDKTGKSMATLKTEMEDSKISAEMVVEAMRSATSEGGRYFGLMEKQSQTSTGTLSTLKDEAHETAVSFGERFSPELKSSIGGLRSLVGVVKRWVDIPTSEKLENEATRLSVLQAELNSTNTEEDRRKEILDELNSKYKITLDNIGDEAEAYKKLNGEIGGVIKSLEHKAVMAGMEEMIEESTSEMAKWISQKAGIYRGVIESAKSTLSAEEFQRIISQPGQSEEAQIQDLDSAVKTKTGRPIYGRGGMSTALNDYYKAKSGIDKYKKELEDNRSLMNDTMKALGISPADAGAGGNAPPAVPGKPPSINGGGSNSVPSISGGGRLTNLTINIDGLVKGGVNISSTTIKESASQLKDIVTEALLSAVNDTNLVAGN